MLAPARLGHSENAPIVQASKKWVVPPRAKPGRKPSKPSPPASTVKEPNESSKQEQAVKKAHKASQDALAALQRELDSVKQQAAAAAARHEAEIDSLRSHVTQLAADNTRLTAENARSSSLVHANADTADRPAKRAKRQTTNFYESAVVTTSSSTSTARAPCEVCPSTDDCVCASIGYAIDRTQAPAALPSALDQVTPSTAAVPLRLRQKKPRTVAPVWRLDAGPSTENKPTLCSGDPTNCPACQDDPFGKAFCNALSSSVCTRNPCPNCPNLKRSISDVRSSLSDDPPEPMKAEEESLFDALTDLPCCGDPQECGSKVCASTSPEASPATAGDEEMLPRGVPQGVRTIETVPCNEAWMTLKSHPNIAFADLQMLADVVARRTTCDGLNVDGRTEEQTDEGNRKRLTVERGAVNEALALLDRQPHKAQ